MGLPRWTNDSLRSPFALESLLIANSHWEVTHIFNLQYLQEVKGVGEITSFGSIVQICKITSLMRKAWKRSKSTVTCLVLVGEPGVWVHADVSCHSEEKMGNVMRSARQATSDSVFVSCQPVESRWKWAYFGRKIEKMFIGNAEWSDPNRQGEKRPEA